MHRFPERGLVSLPLRQDPHGTARGTYQWGPHHEHPLYRGTGLLGESEPGGKSTQGRGMRSSVTMKPSVTMKGTKGNPAPLPSPDPGLTQIS